MGKHVELGGGRRGKWREFGHTLLLSSKWPREMDTYVFVPLVHQMLGSSSRGTDSRGMRAGGGGES